MERAIRETDGRVGPSPPGQFPLGRFRGAEEDADAELFESTDP